MVCYSKFLTSYLHFIYVISITVCHISNFHVNIMKNIGGSYLYTLEKRLNANDVWHYETHNHSTCAAAQDEWIDPSPMIGVGSSLSDDGQSLELVTLEEYCEETSTQIYATTNTISPDDKVSSKPCNIENSMVTEFNETCPIYVCQYAFDKKNTCTYIECSNCYKFPSRSDVNTYKDKQKKRNRKHVQ